MQAIITQYHGPTNYRSARISARASAGKKFYDWDYALGIEENHDRAANRFAESFGWLERHALVGGTLPSNTGNCYVLVPKK